MPAAPRIAPLGFPWQPADPFLFCVHHVDAYPRGTATLGPAASLAGRELGQDFAGRDGWNMYHGELVPGFPQHPHRGFETVTIARRGTIDHSDSLGATARFGSGDVQWLTAGAGIVHSEMFPLLHEDRDNPLELFQIWLNLPAADKMVTPHFAMLWADAIPRPVFRDAQGRETEVTIVAGALGDPGDTEPARAQQRERLLRPPSPPPRSWASRPDSDVAIWTIRMQPGAEWTLPAARAGTHRTLFFFAGPSLRVDDTDVAAKHSITLVGDAPARLVAGPGGCELLLLQGRPIGEPVVQYGPFVMNSRAEIQRAFLDYQATRFGGWPWDRDDPVHDREAPRFAKHADGKVEERDAAE